MADSYVDHILDSARSRLPGAMDKQVLFELADTLNEFFRMSNCWRETVTINVYDSAVLQYEVFTDDLPARMISLLSVVDANNALIGATMISPNLLTFSREPTIGAYNVSAILTVTNKQASEDYPRFPQWVANTYGDVIACGLVGRMAAMPAKPYSSPNHAAYYSRKFKSEANAARAMANRQNLVGGQAWQYPQFAAQNKVR